MNDSNAQNVLNAALVIHLTTCISKWGGGIQSSLIGLANGFSFENPSAEFWSLKEKGLNPEQEGFHCKTRLFDAFPFPLFPISFSLLKALRSSPASLLHIHGLWTFPSLASRSWNKSKPLVISPHGMLDPWALQNSAWKKKIALFFYEKPNLKRCSCFHALCYSEYQSIRALGYRQPIVIIPNGVELANLKHGLEARSREPKTLLYFGRLHKKKNLAPLVNAWKSLPAELKKNWRLRLVGWGDETYREELSALVEPGIILDGPLYGTDKDLAFRTASAFVLPSLSEGFPMAVLEAWSYGLPTLISKECNIPEGFEADSAIETGTSQEKILQSIVNFLRMSNTQMEDMGARGRRLVEEKFTWPLVASKMNSTYEWLLGKKERPECVILE